MGLFSTAAAISPIGNARPRRRCVSWPVTCLDSLTFAVAPPLPEQSVNVADVLRAIFVIDRVVEVDASDAVAQPDRR